MMTLMTMIRYDTVQQLSTADAMGCLIKRTTQKQKNKEKLKTKTE